MASNTPTPNPGKTHERQETLLLKRILEELKKLNKTINNTPPTI
jgi:hypothetical protein